MMLFSQACTFFHVLPLFCDIKCRTITSSSGENLSQSTLLLMPRRDGAFLCMVVAGKQLAFSLRFTAHMLLLVKKLCRYLFFIHIDCNLQDVWHCEICNRKPGRGFGMLFGGSVLR